MMKWYEVQSGEGFVKSCMAVVDGQLVGENHLGELLMKVRAEARQPRN